MRTRESGCWDELMAALGDWEMVVREKPWRKVCLGRVQFLVLVASWVLSAGECVNLGLG